MERKHYQPLFIILTDEGDQHGDIAVTNESDTMFMIQFQDGGVTRKTLYVEPKETEKFAVGEVDADVYLTAVLSYASANMQQWKSLNLGVGVKAGQRLYIYKNEV